MRSSIQTGKITGNLYNSSVNLPHLNILDFDGVLASPMDDCLFRLPISNSDAEFINKCEDYFNLTLDGQDIRSARYMCIQAALMHLEVPIELGPIRLEEPTTAPYVVLTARSDYYAVSRMFRFLESLNQAPLFIFTVGTTSKSHIIQTLSEEYPQADLRFYDDRLENLSPAHALNIKNLRCFHIDNTGYILDEQVYDYYSDIKDKMCKVKL